MVLSKWKFVLKNSLTKIALTNKIILENMLRGESYPARLSLDMTKYLLKFRKESVNNIVQNISQLNIPATFQKNYSPSNIIELSPSWKRKDAISHCSISSQTHRIILSMVTAENESTLLGRVESLIAHIQQYPESRNIAMRAGILPMLLRIRLSKNVDIRGASRVALSILGYSDPVSAKGIRILSMDGGGIRGLLILEMLKKLEELTGKKTYELFDLFCGVSTGAILAFSLGVHRANLDEVTEAYKDISIEVFKQSRLKGTGSLVWNQAYYDTALWEKKLRQHLGTATLINTNRNANCPKLIAVSAVVNQSHVSAYVFRNYSHPWKVKSHYLGSSEYEVWQAARASAAAPTYFEECKLGNFLHQDGGILVNNPTAVALHEAKLIWPKTSIQCVVSFGTGRTVPTCTDAIKDAKENFNSTSWTNKFYKILDSATDTEGVHTMLNDLLPDDVYYRFNPYLTEMIGMTEIDTNKLEQLKRDAVMYLRRNEDKFQEAAKVLMERKTYVQRIQDKFVFKRNLYNL